MESRIDKSGIERIANAMWGFYEQTLEGAKDIYKKKYNIDLSINAKNKQAFINNFYNRYRFVLEMFMDSNVKKLDRHKVAAIGSIEFILAEALIYTQPILDGGEIFIPEYVLALETGFSYMMLQFNNLLEVHGMNVVKKWHWPISLSCPKNEFILIIARHLYFTTQRSKWGDGAYASGFNELDLAERLFYIEWTTILEEKIDYHALKQKG